MLATPCPACGAANPTCLPSPSLYRCELCKYEGPPRAQDVPRIEALAKTVQTIHDRTLQLSRLETNMLVSARGASALFLILFALLLFPVIITTGVVDWVSDVTDRPLIGLSLAPALLMLLCGGASAVLLHRRHRALISACAADPPRAGEETGRCNVCGAPLISPPGSVVARCGFCGADNLVSKETMARVQRAHETGLELYERRLLGRQRSMRGATRMADVLVLGAGLFGCGVIALSANEVLDETAEANRAGFELAAIDLHSLLCFGRREREEVSFGGDRSRELPESLEVRHLRPRRVRVSELRGRKVMLPDGQWATVEQVLARDDAVWVRAKSDDVAVERPLIGLCASAPGL
jgi:uncharacterized Zn finger protein (UPF0148 family)